MYFQRVRKVSKPFYKITLYFLMEIPIIPARTFILKKKKKDQNRPVGSGWAHRLHDPHESFV